MSVNDVTYDLTQGSLHRLLSSSVWQASWVYTPLTPMSTSPLVHSSITLYPSLLPLPFPHPPLSESSAYLLSSDWLKCLCLEPVWIQSVVCVCLLFWLIRNKYILFWYERRQVITCMCYHTMCYMFIYKEDINLILRWKHASHNVYV